MLMKSQTSYSNSIRSPSCNERINPRIYSFKERLANYGKSRPLFFVYPELDAVTKSNVNFSKIVILNRSYKSNSTKAM